MCINTLHLKVRSRSRQLISASSTIRIRGAAPALLIRRFLRLIFLAVERGITLLLVTLTSRGLATSTSMLLADAHGTVSDVTAPCRCCDGDGCGDGCGDGANARVKEKEEPSPGALCSDNSPTYTEHLVEELVVHIHTHAHTQTHTHTHRHSCTNKQVPQSDNTQRDHQTHRPYSQRAISR